jgi:hypothetical protein
MANEFIARNGLISLSTITTSNSGINIGPTITGISSDGTSIYIKSGGNTYLNTSNNAYVSAAGVIYGTGFSGPGTSLTGNYGGTITSTQVTTALGFTPVNYTHPAYTTRSITATGASVLSTFTSDAIGSVTGITTRTLTLANLGYTGATNANYITAVSQLSNDSGYTTNTGTVTGTGLSNYITKWSSTTAITYSSAIYDDSSQAGISSPIIRLSSSQIFIGLSGSSTTIIGDYDGGGTTAIVQVSATLRVTRDVIAYYSSDKRLKDNIKKISDPLNKISKIGGYEFDWNGNQDTYIGHDIGVIAQEIEGVLPELVTTRVDGYKAVKYEKIVALLIEGIKDQQKLIENQQIQIDSLLNK